MSPALKKNRLKRKATDNSTGTGKDHKEIRKVLAWSCSSGLTEETGSLIIEQDQALCVIIKRTS